MNDRDELSIPTGRDTTAPPKKTRTRSGCLVCRRRRRKCDELRPECLNCRQRGEVCEWGLKITFRTDNAAQLDAEHPSMREGSRKRARHFKIVDVTSQIERCYQAGLADATDLEGEKIDVTANGSTPQIENNTSPGEQLLPEPRLPNRTSESDPCYDPQWHSESPSFDTPNSMTVSYPDESSFQADEDQYMHVERSSGPELHGYAHELEHSEASQRNTSFSQINTEDVAADLLALRYLPLRNLQQQSRNNVNPRILMPPPNNTNADHNVDEDQITGHEIFDGHQDGIFLPGSAYQEFHSTLRDHLIYTARSNAPTRNVTPELFQPELSSFDRLASRSDHDVALNRINSDPESARASKPPEITLQREFTLWKNWIDEMAPWLDKFDNKRHFEHKIPMMAKNTPHLKNSMLALSARQIEMKESSKSSSESLALYQEAIHLLLPELQTKCTAIIASCVILCVLEMMSCSPKEWRRHLEGCANLLEAVGINGFVGGVEEALFWCFARMDLCGALISQDLTLIPVERWTSNVDFASDIRLFRNPSNGFDTYANYAVFLCANCVTCLEGKGRARHTNRTTWVSRWTELLGLLDDWYTERPEEMKAILTIPALESEAHSPFPTMLYGNGPAVSGNQLYHTAMLLMLQEKPGELNVQRKQKSIFWHARQICAISESNTHHGAWTNSIQPLWIAGKVMSHPSEHRAILDILERIERETGWVTSWRREDLEAWWGDSDD